MDQSEKIMPGPVAVALAGWVVPGLGYWLIGERGRAYIAGATIVALFLLGLLIGGVRIIDVPGYDGLGNKRMLGARWSLTARPLPTLMDKPWFIPQILAGPITVASGYVSLSVADTVQKARAVVGDVGTLYTAVAGMLNLLIMIDAAHRSARWRAQHPQLGPM